MIVFRYSKGIKVLHFSLVAFEFFKGKKQTFYAVCQKLIHNAYHICLWKVFIKVNKSFLFWIALIPFFYQHHYSFNSAIFAGFLLFILRVKFRKKNFFSFLSQFLQSPVDFELYKLVCCCNAISNTFFLPRKIIGNWKIQNLFVENENSKI